jgi:uncharacterized membrane protein
MRKATLLAALLGASVVLNLVLGWLVLATPTPREHRGRGFDRMVARIEASLPEPDRPVFRGVLEAERDHYAAALAALRASRAEVDSAMARDPFDPDALRLAMTRWSERWIGFNATFTETLVHAMAAVSPEGRARIAAARPPGG